MALTFRQVRYFIAAADAGKVSLAAANLNISQSAITSAIKGLEAELGARLFKRHSNGISLTYEGHQFLQHAGNIVAAVSEATRATKRSGASVTGEINVAVTYTVAGYFLPSIMARFMRAFPGIKIQLHELERPKIERGIVKGDFDIGVVLVVPTINSIRRTKPSVSQLRSLALCACTQSFVPFSTASFPASDGELIYRSRSSRFVISWKSFNAGHEPRFA